MPTTAPPSNNRFSTMEKNPTSSAKGGMFRDGNRNDTQQEYLQMTKQGLENLFQGENGAADQETYKKFIDTQARLDNLKQLKQQSFGENLKLSGDEKAKYEGLIQTLSQEAATHEATLKQRYQGNTEAMALMFNNLSVKDGHAASQIGAALNMEGSHFAPLQWEGDHDQMSQKARDQFNQQMQALAARYGQQERKAPIPQAAAEPVVTPQKARIAEARSTPMQAQVSPTVTVGQLQVAAPSQAMVGMPPDINAQRRAMMAEMGMQFNHSRGALAYQLGQEADAQRLAFSQEMMPQLTGDAAMAGHFGSTRQGIAEGVARGRMESQLSASQAQAVAGLESNLSFMQNQWGLSQLDSLNQFALQDLSGQQDLARIGIQGQTDVDVARQKGMSEVDLARLMGNVDLGIYQQRGVMDQQRAAQQAAMEQAMAQQNAMTQWDLEQRRNAMSLEEKQALMAREQAFQLQLKGMDAEQAMAMQMVQGQQSMDNTGFQSQLDLEKLMTQAQLDQQKQKIQAELDTGKIKTQAQLDAEKIRLQNIYNLMGPSAMVGILDGQDTGRNLTAAALRQELGLPVFQQSAPGNGSISQPISSINTLVSKDIYGRIQGAKFGDEAWS